MYKGLHAKYPLFLSDFNEFLIFTADFTKIPQNQISRKFVEWEPRCSMQADMTKLIVAFRIRERV